MTPAALRALLAKATPGPWVEHGHGVIFSEVDDENVADVFRTPTGTYFVDAPLIVAAVNALPALLDVAEAAQSFCDKLTVAPGDKHSDVERYNALVTALSRVVPNVNGGER